MSLSLHLQLQTSDFQERDGLVCLCKSQDSNSASPNWSTPILPGRVCQQTLAYRKTMSCSDTARTHTYTRATYSTGKELGQTREHSMDQRSGRGAVCMDHYIEATLLNFQIHAPSKLQRSATAIVSADLYTCTCTPSNEWTRLARLWSYRTRRKQAVPALWQLYSHNTMFIIYNLH